MIVKYLYEPIERKDILVGVIKSKWKNLNRKVVATIRQCVDISVLQHVASDTNANQDLQHMTNTIICKDSSSKVQDGDVTIGKRLYLSLVC